MSGPASPSGRPGNPIAVVFGSSRPTAGEPAWRSAFELGRGLALAGFTVATGGYGGTMAGASGGARSAGAHTIGVTCDVWAGGPNEHVVEEVRTADLLARLDALVGLGDAFCALPGHTGTLVELALVWELLAKRLTRPRPLVCVGAFWDPLIELVASAGGRTGPWLIRAPDVPSAVQAVASWGRPCEPGRSPT